MTSPSGFFRTLLAVVEQQGLRVPDLWPREVANGLAVAYLRNRITPDDEKAFLAALSHLSIDVEEAPALTVVRDGTAAAKRYGLTAYDAAYVDLASREGLVPATLDAAMGEAAEQSGVIIFRQ
jgi:predicted nucleic acid-binding protein